tara:strand:+ start:676 stop:948 length:273 start_codon:yes stop_codon:yes gene_type:complete
MELADWNHAMWKFQYLVRVIDFWKSPGPGEYCIGSHRLRLAWPGNDQVPHGTGSSVNQKEAAGSATGCSKRRFYYQKWSDWTVMPVINQI